ncbi:MULTISPECIES: ankyrin repeat domain-containing protein [unclassified Acidovorax]|uniref:ankyrin repeat domain-containing protein n=1 Tax=unclassified Acidovorax TaxID=2684926 RepID=UPI000A8C590C|nr:MULTISPECIES: ankyrin repeat domain-containing protein [unclassified Acidovorax]
MNANDNFYNQSIFSSIESGDLDGLLEGIRFDDVNLVSIYDGLTYLMIAVQKSDARAVRVLIEGGANLYAKNDLGDMAIHLAAKSGNLIIAKTFYELGCDLNVMGQSATPLSYALRFGWFELAKYLAGCGADIDLADEFGITARELALKIGAALK